VFGGAVFAGAFFGGNGVSIASVIVPAPTMVSPLFAVTNTGRTTVAVLANPTSAGLGSSKTSAKIP